MPELPEVETVCRGLAPIMSNATITRVDQNRPDLRFPFPDRFAERLAGRRIVSLSRRAKYLLADLDDRTVLVMHLGMSGRFLATCPGHDAPVGHFQHEAVARTAHDHVAFHLETATGQKARVVYNDTRRFGFMDLVPRADLANHRHFRHLGVEPLGNALDAIYLAERFSTRSAPLKSVLLDQSVVAGLGNIYVCEALYRARLSPARRAETLVRKNRTPTKRLERLTIAVRKVIADAIEAGGSTLRDYVRTNGELGYFQHCFDVYGREAEPCLTHGCRGIVQRTVQSGRSTFFCASCQK